MGSQNSGACKAEQGGPGFGVQFDCVALRVSGSISVCSGLLGPSTGAGSKTKASSIFV